MRLAGPLVAGALLLLGVVPMAGATNAGSHPFSNSPSRADYSHAATPMEAAIEAIAPGFPSEVDCEVDAGGAANVNLDCDTILPNNEPQIAVNPLDPLHMVASSNDFDSCCDEFYTTFDGGEHWVTGNMSAVEDATGSDPVTTFDVKNDVVIHSSLNFSADFDYLVVSRSEDGGVTWDEPVIVARGFAGFGGRALQNDKEWMVTDNNPASPFYGRTYITWTGFFIRDFEVARSPILEAHSDDGGLTWSAPQVISGRSTEFCTQQDTGKPHQCDQDQGSVPTVGPDGNVYVAFTNQQHEEAWERNEVFENQWLVVRSTDGGVTWSNPVHVVDMEDGSRDYPFNVNGRRTLTNYQLRVNSRGNIVADPNTGRLYLPFSDNRAGEHDVRNPVTETNIYLMTSDDEGATWQGPFDVDTSPGDQWFPWADVNPVTGEVGVLYHDRLHRLDNKYHTTLAEGQPGSWSYTQVSTEPSFPRRSAFFQARVEDCMRCATFHGDYIGVAYGPDGVANTVWTDMRDPLFASGVFGQFVYFARVP